MTQQSKHEFRVHKAIRRMIEQEMTVRPFVTKEGTLIHYVDGYPLTAEQILELDEKYDLTHIAVAEYAMRQQEEQEKKKPS